MVAALSVAVAILLSGPVAAATAPNAVRPPFPPRLPPTPSSTDVWSSEFAGGGNASTNEAEYQISTATASRLAPAWQIDNSDNTVAPAIVGGVVYHSEDAGFTSEPSHLIATSVTTGQLLWSTDIGTYRQYGIGQAVVGQLILLPYYGEGHDMPGGITAVSLKTHQILWSHARAPEPGDEQSVNGYANRIVTDAGRAYFLSGEGITAFDVATGAIVWHRNILGGVQGMAAGGGFLYTAGFAGDATDQGLVAYDGATGIQRWGSPIGYGQPVVAAGRVFVGTIRAVSAFPAAGCGHIVCTPMWTTSFPDPDIGELTIGGADAHTLFVDDAANGQLTFSTLYRLDATSGAVGWSVPLNSPVGPVPVRIADMVWLLVGGNTLTGWSVTATGPTPTRTITRTEESFAGGLAGADGTLIVADFAASMTAYRIPPTATIRPRTVR